jgi:hypothetical protein
MPFLLRLFLIASVIIALCLPYQRSDEQACALLPAFVTANTQHRAILLRNDDDDNKPPRPGEKEVEGEFTCDNNLYLTTTTFENKWMRLAWKVMSSPLTPLAQMLAWKKAEFSPQHKSKRAGALFCFRQI